MKPFNRNCPRCSRNSLVYSKMTDDILVVMCSGEECGFVGEFFHRTGELKDFTPEKIKKTFKEKKDDNNKRPRRYYG